jgi:hypothetical protein
MSDEKILKVEVQALDRRRSVVAPLMIGGGAMLLAANLFHFDLMSFLWPLFVITPGVLLMLPAYRSTADDQSRASFLAIPGSFILTVGLLLSVMNLTGHFEAWAYAWILTVAGVAAGISYWKRFESDHSVHGKADRLIRNIVFLAGGMMLFFELIVFETLGPWWPLALIVAGFYLWRKEN